jgi:hypothetical protein
VSGSPLSNFSSAVQVFPKFQAFSASFSGLAILFCRRACFGFARHGIINRRAAIAFPSVDVVITNSKTL